MEQDVADGALSIYIEMTVPAILSCPDEFCASPSRSETPVHAEGRMKEVTFAPAN